MIWYFVDCQKRHLATPPFKIGPLNMQFLCSEEECIDVSVNAKFELKVGLTTKAWFKHLSDQPK